MEKVEQFIIENTRYYSNEIGYCHNKKRNYDHVFYAWLTPSQAECVAQIAREETINEVCEWIKCNVGKYSWYDPIEDNEGFNVSGLIDDLKKHKGQSMKSIKEKAEEHLRENNITQYEYKSYIEGADFGANYVLEEIEKCVKSSSNSRLKIDTIKQIIEQLKK